MSYVNIARTIFQTHEEATVSALGNTIDSLITGARTAGCQAKQLPIVFACRCLLHVSLGHSLLTACCHMHCRIPGLPTCHA